MMLGRLFSFWLLVYFEGRTVKLLESKSLNLRSFTLLDLNQSLGVFFRPTQPIYNAGCLAASLLRWYETLDRVDEERSGSWMSSFRCRRHGICWNASSRALIEYVVINMIDIIHIDIWHNMIWYDFVTHIQFLCTQYRHSDWYILSLNRLLFVGNRVGLD